MSYHESAFATMHEMRRALNSWYSQVNIQIYPVSSYFHSLSWHISVISSLLTRRSDMVNVVGRDSSSLLSSLILATSRRSNVVELLRYSSFALMISIVFLLDIPSFFSLGSTGIYSCCSYLEMYWFKLF